MGYTYLIRIGIIHIIIFFVKSHCIILVSKGKRESTNYIERDIFFSFGKYKLFNFGRENAAADDDKNAYFQKGIEIHIGN